MEKPITNVEILKVLLNGNPVALELVTAASKAPFEDAPIRTKEVLLTMVQAKINSLKNAQTEMD